MKITSAPGPDHLILNWNRLKGLKIDLEWTRNGPGLDLDLDLSLTKDMMIACDCFKDYSKSQIRRPK